MHSICSADLPARGHNYIGHNYRGHNSIRAADLPARAHVCVCARTGAGARVVCERTSDVEARNIADRRSHCKGQRLSRKVEPCNSDDGATEACDLRRRNGRHNRPVKLPRARISRWMQAYAHA